MKRDGNEKGAILGSLGAGFVGSHVLVLKKKIAMHTRGIEDCLPPLISGQFLCMVMCKSVVDTSIE